MDGQTKKKTDRQAGRRTDRKKLIVFFFFFFKFANALINDETSRGLGRKS